MFEHLSHAIILFVIRAIVISLLIGTLPKCMFEILSVLAIPSYGK